MDNMSKPAHATRGRLLEAAFDEIYRSGFQAASVAEILGNAGMTKGALYYHFPNKHALGLAVIEEVIQERLASDVFRPLQAAEHPLKVLLEILQKKGERATQETMVRGCPLNNLVQEMSSVDAMFRAKLSGILLQWQTVLREALVQGQHRHEVRADVDCEGAALFILASWEGCIGIAKNRQSITVFRHCLTELQRYIRSLAPDPCSL